VKRKSVARSSVSLPWARYRARGRGGVFSGGNNKVDLRRQVLKQKGEDFVDGHRRINGVGIDHMIIIENEDEVVRYCCKIIEQGCQNRFGWRFLRRLERTQHPFSEIWYDCLYSSDKVN
jgi:hypothetical protein